jgi:hypothetical protein
MTTLSVLHWAFGFIVMAEALNKLERADLFDGKRGLIHRLGGLLWLLTPWRWKGERITHVFEVLGWALLAIGAAGAFVTPLLHLSKPSFQDTAVISGAALLIIWRRLKEMNP